MTTPARPLTTPDVRSTPDAVRWDAVVAVGLGLALLACGWLDVRAYRADLRKNLPAFQFVNTPVGARVGMDEFFHETSTSVHLANIGSLEWEDKRADLRKFRQAAGPVATVEIWSALRQARLEFDFRNPVEDQTITVAYNGQVLEEIHPPMGEFTRGYDLELRPGSNLFTLTFARYRGHGYDLRVPDKRAIAGNFRALNLFLP